MIKAVRVCAGAALFALMTASAAMAHARHVPVDFSVDGSNKFFATDGVSNFRITSVRLVDTVIGQTIDAGYDACVSDLPLGSSQTDCESAFIKSEKAKVVEIVVDFDGPDDRFSPLRFRFRADRVRPEVLAALQSDDAERAAGYFSANESHGTAVLGHVVCSNEDEGSPRDCDTVSAPTETFAVSVAQR